MDKKEKNLQVELNIDDRQRARAIFQANFFLILPFFGLMEKLWELLFGPDIEDQEYLLFLSEKMSLVGLSCWAFGSVEQNLHSSYFSYLQSIR